MRWLWISKGRIVPFSCGENLVILNACMLTLGRQAWPWRLSWCTAERLAGKPQLSFPDVIRTLFSHIRLASVMLWPCSPG
ncbi:hypothetical protein LX36DRAFT_51266 [Colletotrichum falcatum]|nr:hypothetical protein LX36DRAFT_51266 [Colletotrichum falcatum]